MLSIQITFYRTHKSLPTSEKRQYLQREAVKEQINISTATLNKIDAIRNAHRKEAMREFDDWRVNAELPFLPEVEGEIQENRKAYKYLYKILILTIYWIK